MRSCVGGWFLPHEFLALENSAQPTENMNDTDTDSFCQYLRGVLVGLGAPVTLNTPDADILKLLADAADARAE